MPDRQHELDLALESMHFGFRAMIYQPDQRLALLGLSRVHHRLLYFIARNADCSINQLLGIMRVSKQYCHRPLKQLLSQSYVTQRVDEQDRRVKRLRLSAKGKRLEQELTEVQRKRFAEIFAAAGAEAEKHWRQVMKLLSQRLES